MVPIAVRPQPRHKLCTRNKEDMRRPRRKVGWVGVWSRKGGVPDIKPAMEHVHMQLWVLVRAPTPRQKAPRLLPHFGSQRSRPRHYVTSSYIQLFASPESLEDISNLWWMYRRLPLLTLGWASHFSSLFKKKKTSSAHPAEKEKDTHGKFPRHILN